jgi:hypothetical protein
MKTVYPHVSVHIQGVREPLTIEEFKSITDDWEKTNSRRAELVEKEVAKTITVREGRELKHLQRLAGAKRQLILPLPTSMEKLQVIDLRDIYPNLEDEIASDCRDCD